jgi:hypothetical protein
LLLLLVADRRHLRAHRNQLVLGLFPVAAGDQILHLVQFGTGSQCDLVVTDLLRRTEKHCAQTV